MGVEKAKRRLEIIRKAIREDDIEKLYGEDQPTLERIKNVASSDIPHEIDVVIEDALTDYDVEFGALDIPEKEIIRVLVFAARITGTKIKWNILMTKVEELAVRAGPAVGTASALEVSVIRGCPECEKELEDPDFCSDCGWESDNPINQ